MKEIINQIVALEQKSKKENVDVFTRNIERIYHELEVMGYQIINPLGKPYKNEMTDIEATITGELTKDMKVTKVLKPVIYKITNEEPILIQKGIVIVA